MKIKLTLIILTVVLSGCANNFAANYTSLANTSSPTYIPSNAPVQVIITEDLSNILSQYLRKGYLPVGKSEFQANGRQSKDDLKKQAIAVGAQVAIATREDLGSSTISMPITTPSTSTTYSTSNYNIYGNKGINSIRGATTSTTYGTQTNYIPLTINSGKYTAVFLAKFKSKSGIIPFGLSDESKRKLQQNSGVMVGEVVENSPAYYANIIKGDIILDVDKKEVFGVDGFIKAIDDSNSNKVSLKILRNENVITKNIDLAN